MLDRQDLGLLLVPCDLSPKNWTSFRGGDQRAAYQVKGGPLHSVSGLGML